GQASNTFSFGSGSGASVIRASAFGGALNIDFAANAVMVSLVASSGNGQAGPVLTALPVALTVQISPPAGVFAAPGSGPHKPLALSGVPITFAVTGGGGSISLINALTNAAGQASTVLTLGPAAGTNTVSATVLGGPSTSFSATGLTAAVASGLTIVSGNNQVLDPSVSSSPLTVELRDSGGVVIAGATVNWTSTGGTLASASSVTNASGRASNTIQLNGLGTVQVSATAPAFASAPAVFNLNVALTNLTGLNPLQTEVANAIDTLCPALAADTSLSPEQNDLLQQCQRILGSAGIDTQDTINALDELFSDVALAQANASMLAAQSQFQNLKARIAALRSGTGGTSFGGLALNTPSGSVPIASLVSALNGDSNAADKSSNSGDFERWGFFASGSIGRGEAEAGSINPAFDYDINGLSAGVDYRMSDRLIIGAALGFTQQGTTLPGSDGSVDTTGWSASAYSTFYQQNNWYADAVLTYGQNRFDLQRHISYTLPLFGGGFTTVDQIANAKSDGSMLSAAFTFGRDCQKGGWAIGPYGRMMYTKLDFDAYDEILLSGNGSGLGLHIEDRSVTSLATILGSKFAYSHSTDWGVLIPHLQLEWEREFKEDPQSIQASFIYDPTGTPITVTGDPLDKSFFRIGLGLSMILTKGRSGFIYYEKMIGRDRLDQENLSMGLRMEF
ncbi:MAG: autotransporter domain-containing protein, partial [Arenimonas sp.]